MRGLLMDALGQAGEFYEPYHGHDVADMDVVLTNPRNFAAPNVALPRQTLR